MNLITPIILIIISIAVFFGYIDPNYRGQDSDMRSVESLKAENDQYVNALTNSNKIREQRNTLSQKKSQISQEEIDNLERLLPDNIDNIKLVIDIKNIASKPQNGNLTLSGVKLDTGTTSSDPKKLGADNSRIGTVGLSFNTTASYSNFSNFITDLEKSMRLVDITDLSVISNDNGLYTFSVSLKTYWLK